jgi:MauM/NapG family ferredoxin protein
MDFSKRAFVSAGVAGLGGVVLSRLSPQSQGQTFNPVLIRPPGACAEREFLQLCVQCGLCMKICPTNALHPTTFEAGLEGIWTPVLIPMLGYCDYECTLCGEVCPTGAIAKLPLLEKKKVRIGLATFDTTRCLPYAYNRDCIVCEEHCPTPQKAIYFVQKEITRRDGTLLVVKQPMVDTDLCIGCGICEKECVFKDRAAIRVTSANESRHPKNQPILPSLGGELPLLPPTTTPAQGSDPYANPYGG